MRGKLAAILLIFISGCCGKERIVERDGCIYSYDLCGKHGDVDCAHKEDALIESEENEQQK